MIEIQIWRRADGEVYRFRAEGHAGYAKRGQDIVCSAVAALTQSAALGLMEIAGVKVDVEVDPEIGLLDCTIAAKQVDQEKPDGDSCLAAAKQSAILETLLLGLRQIEAEYGRYVTVIEKTV